MADCFKANSAILNSMLSVINERRYAVHGTWSDCPLISMFAASNELPQGEDLGALFDRLHLRVIVQPIASDDGFERLLTVPTPDPKATITLDDIKAATAESDAIPLSKNGLAGIHEIRRAATKLGIRISDRRWKAMVPVLKAAAWFDGATEIDKPQLGILVHGLWETPEERKKVIDMVLEVACPILRQVLELADQAAEQLRIAKTSPKDQPIVEEAWIKIKAIATDAEAIAEQPQNAKVAAVQEHAKRILRARQEIATIRYGVKA